MTIRDRDHEFLALAIAQARIGRDEGGVHPRSHAAGLPIVSPS